MQLEFWEIAPTYFINEVSGHNDSFIWREHDAFDGVDRRVIGLAGEYFNHFGNALHGVVVQPKEHIDN